MKEIKTTELNHEDIYQLFRNGNIFKYEILNPIMNFTYELDGKKYTNIIYEHQLNLLLAEGRDDSKSLADMVLEDE